MEYVDFHPRVKLAYSTVENGNIDYRFSAKTEVKENRKHIFKDFGVKSYEIIEGRQMHGTRILPLDEENCKMWRGNDVMGIDGFIITNITDIALMLRVADCVPLILYDPEHHALGVFHVGWRGAIKDFHTKGLDLMAKTYATKPRQLFAWIGPSAGDMYLSAEKPQQSTDPAWKPFIRRRKDSWHVDMPGFIAASLKNAGIFKKNTTIDPHSTINSPHLFSHQRAKTSSEKEGRFAVLVKLL